MTALPTTHSTASAALAHRSDRLRGWLLWGALGIAFSPVLLDLLQHQLAQPWSRYSAVFLLLMPWAASRAGIGALPRRDGHAWIALGVGIALLAVGGGMPRLARPGLVLAVIGLARLLGRPPLRVLLLSLWIVPIPHRALDLLSPGFESLSLYAAAGLLSPLGLDLRIDVASASAGGDLLSLSAGQSGVPLALQLSGLGYYAALRTRQTLGGRVWRTCLWALLAVPVQIGSIAAALVLLSLGMADAARVFLAQGVWLGVALVAIAHAERAARAADTQRTARAAESGKEG